MDIDNIKVGQPIKLKVIKEGVGRGKTTRNLKGKVSSKTSYLLVVDNGRYKESFKFTDFTCGNAMIIN